MVNIVIVGIVCIIFVIVIIGYDKCLYLVMKILIGILIIYVNNILYIDINRCLKNSFRRKV